MSKVQIAAGPVGMSIVQGAAEPVGMSKVQGAAASPNWEDAHRVEKLSVGGWQRLAALIARAYNQRD